MVIHTSYIYISYYPSILHLCMKIKVTYWYLYFIQRYTYLYDIYIVFIYIFQDTKYVIQKKKKQNAIYLMLLTWTNVTLCIINRSYIFMPVLNRYYNKFYFFLYILLINTSKIHYIKLYKTTSFVNVISVYFTID